ncbi:MAG: chloride channel protein [Rhodospirillales bacterium]|nr:chloride channel protein [Rhodospirillales bacterium]MBO6785330.1 chloride channel protein [Rhodospirillales bacterium]
MSETARRSVYRVAVLSAVGVGVGAAASAAAIGFVELIELLNEILLISPHARIQYEETPGLVIAATLLVPAAGGILVAAVIRFGIAERRALGPPDAILAVQTGAAPPSVRSGLGSTLAALVSLGCGASVGQYGPLVYLGTLIGQLTSRLRFGLHDLQSISIACGVAAAISTAFNAPIAGIVFAHEVILRHYSLRAFAPVTVASAVGYILANVVFERAPLFLVHFDGVRHGYEFILFAGVGVCGALIAVAFMRLLTESGKMAARLPIPDLLKPGLAGLVLGLIALQLPEVLGIGKEALRFATIEGAFGLGELAALVIAKIFVTVMCVGFGFVGGVFSPALLIGILFGALSGATVGTVLPDLYSGVVVYAICGMTAVFSPVIGAPLTAIMIIFELTRSYDLTIAAMVAVVFSNLVANRLFGRSLFDVQLANRGFDLSLGRDRAILRNCRITELGDMTAPTASPDEPLRDALDRLNSAGRAEAPVVDADGTYHGILRAGSASTMAADARVRDNISGQGLVFDETTTLWDALERMRAFIGDAAAIVDSRDRRFLGSVTEAAVIGAYLDTVQVLRREENAAL